MSIYYQLKLVCYHSINDIPCPHSKLKGASAVATTAVNQQPKQFVFNSNEVQILAKVFEICRIYVNKNSSLFQQPQDILNKLSKSIDIINTRQNNNKNNKESNLKGASSVICNETKIQSLKNIIKLFNQS